MGLWVGGFCTWVRPGLEVQPAAHSFSSPHSTEASVRYEAPVGQSGLDGGAQVSRRFLGLLSGQPDGQPERMFQKTGPGNYSRRSVGAGAFSTAESVVATTMGLGT